MGLYDNQIQTYSSQDSYRQYPKSYNSKEKKLLLYTLMPIASFSVIVYALGLAILAIAVNSVSIAKSYFIDGSADLIGIFVGYIVVGALNLVYLFTFACIFTCGKLITQYIAILGIANLLFNVVSEGIFYKFAICFSFPTNGIVIARSSFAIILMLTLIIVPFSLHFFRSVNGGIDKKSRVNDALMNSFLIIPCLGIIALNIALIAQLKSQLNYTLSPYNIQMGFFNSSEISLIQNGTYVKTSTFDDQLIGSLSNVMYSPNKIFDHRECHWNGKSQSCTDYYMHFYSPQITCNQQTQQFYQDCVGSSQIKIKMKYLDDGPYPTYNCVANRTYTEYNRTYYQCVTCDQLFSSYNLILIQQVNNKVELAWTGLCSCSGNPNIRLSQDMNISPCDMSNGTPKFYQVNFVVILSVFLFQLVSCTFF